MNLNKEYIYSLYKHNHFNQLEIEIELMIRTPMFFPIRDSYKGHYRSIIIEENVYKYYQEGGVVLRKYLNTYQMKEKISHYDIGPVRMRYSLERNFNKDIFEEQGNEMKKVHYYHDHIVRIKCRDIVKRGGYEIHFTTVGMDKYIEIEITNYDVIDFTLLEEDYLRCTKDYDYEIPKLLRKVSHKAISPDMKIIKPIELTRKIFRNNTFLMNKFYLTRKLDGQRMFLIYDENNLIAVDTSGHHYVVASNVKLGDTSMIFDIEYYHKKYYIFDVLYYDNDLTTNTSYDLIDRLNLIKDIEFPKYIKIKNVVIINSQKELHEKLVKYNVPDLNDGVIIYRPGATYVQSNSVFKFKYVPTIDVKTNFVDVYIQVKGADHKVDIPIIGEKTSEPIIVECIYNNGVLEKLKDRPDKNKPNGLMVYENFISMYKDNQLLTVNDFSDKSDNVFLMQVYHNQIKSDIISSLSGEILDIGSGRGGDLYKWKSNDKIVSVDCVEPNKDNYSVFMKRLDESKVRNVNTHNTDFLNYDNNGKTYDYITALFMLNCVPRSDIDAFIGKMHKLLKNKGVAHIIMMDSDHIKTNKFITYDEEMCTVNYPGTMVIDHKETLYSSGEIINKRKGDGFSFVVKEKDVKRLSNSWLSGINKDICEMYTHIRFVKKS